MEYLHIKDYIIIIIQSCRQSSAMMDFSLLTLYENKAENLNTALTQSSWPSLHDLWACSSPAGNGKKHSLCKSLWP